MVVYIYGIILMEVHISIFSNMGLILMVLKLQNNNDGTKAYKYVM